MSAFFCDVKFFFFLVLEVSKQSVSSTNSEVTHIIQERIPKLNYSHLKLFVGGLI